MRRVRTAVPRTRHPQRTPPHPHGRDALHLRVLRQELPVQGRIDHTPSPAHRRTSVLVSGVPASLHELAQLQQAHETAARHKHERHRQETADDTPDGHAAEEPARIGAGATSAARHNRGGKLRRAPYFVLSRAEFV